MEESKTPRPPFNPDAPLRIDEVRVLWVEDESPPDFLGHYTDEWQEGAIDRAQLEEQKQHEYRYFVGATYDKDYPENAMADYRRYQTYCAGGWSLEGCLARALVSYPVGNGNRRLEFLSSGSVSGIESDSGAAFKLEIEIQQLEELKRHVQVFCVPWSDAAETLLNETRSRLAAEQAREKAQRPAS